MATSLLHELDFYAWTQQQVALIKSGNFVDVDFKHLIEEIERMGVNERRELINRLAVLSAHLLKWHYQPSFRGRSWQLTIKKQRRQLQRLLKDNPSLQARLAEFIADAYVDSVLLAAKETGLEESDFPVQCPYGQDDILDSEFYPV
ncbi:DUF29 domain-containing protein [Methylicorpusculum oleiharenae]|uniref:DUF29 domain-containing protein n=1 Tax=Methylicorpusculum oleiharenae TaxID=1338687 RepID=UPI00135BF069|nr:DUF29 domain-containing protein [Methylicorpusculum oleiharenae]MCD2450828.1 DUF29 domain-containing protein [Methylicorpusculum oleiharenae]